MGILMDQFVQKYNPGTPNGDVSEHCMACGRCDDEEESCSTANMTAPSGDEQLRDRVKEITRLVLERLETEQQIPQLNLSSKMAANVSAQKANVIAVGVSNRHCHLTRESVDALFGPGYELTEYRPLYQPNQYAAKETVTILGPKLRAIESVRILYPLRNYNQIEISKTDAFYLGVNPPIKDSGDHQGSEALTLVGPKGSVFIEEGCILAGRHIHMHPDDAARFGVKDKEYVKLHVPSERALTLEKVLVRVNPGYKLECHLDTDDANASGIYCGYEAELVK
jgi:putative phosphotransacetylase